MGNRNNTTMSMGNKTNSPKSPDGLDHVSHLQIMHTWASFALEHGNIPQIFDDAAVQRIKLWTDEMIRDMRPRVMTIKEVQGIRYRPVWIETQDEEFQCWVMPIQSIKGFGDPGVIKIALFGDKVIDFKTAEYGSDWRCWTDEPSDAEMERTRWSDE